MQLFFHILHNMLPLYAIMLIGMLAGRRLQLDGKTLGNLALFVLVPAVMVRFVVDIELRAEYALLPLIVVGAEAMLALVTYQIAKRLYPDGRANLVTMCAVMGNTGYFGIPVVLMVFGPDWLGVYMFMLLGTIIFQATGGYYLAARGSFTAAESMRKLARFPFGYAIVAALAINLAGVELPESLDIWQAHVQGAFIIIGMLIIGIALPPVRELRFDPVFVGYSFVVKYLVWPAIMAGVIWLDVSQFHLFEPEIHWMLMIIAIMPPAANVPALAIHLDLLPDKAATVVMTSTLFALVYVPLVLWLTGKVIPTATLGG
ncbi:MAG: AEC family transporter [Alphaproteobacteria bacterium]